MGLRCIEFSLGNKNPNMRAPHEASPERLAAVDTALHTPSLYDEALRLLARRGLPMPQSHTERDWTKVHHSPIFWVGVVMCLAAIMIYVLSDDLSWVPGRG